MKRIELISVVTDGKNCKLYNDDGFFINWTETLSIENISSLVKKANELAEKQSNEKVDCLKTIIEIDDDIENPNLFALSKYEMYYIKKLGLKEHWESESQMFQEKIRVIQRGLF
jgi:hypothetical protein